MLIASQQNEKYNFRYLIKQLLISNTVELSWRLTMLFLWCMRLIKLYAIFS